jgi:putative PIN family toxin of toxin-antitoxin system
LRSFTRCGASATPPRDARDRRLERPRLRAHRSTRYATERAWARERFELVVSPQLISEVAGVLARPKFARYVTPEEVADFLDMLRSDAVVHPDPAFIERATRDPHDDYLVAVATAAGAVLVSGDRDVLEADIGDLEVLNAREFIDRLA